MRKWQEYKAIVFSGVAIILFFVGAFLVMERVEQKDSAYTYAEHLFQEEIVNEINIAIAEADWQDLLENPLKEEYHRADITINGETVGNVAIRTKGNTSLTSVANMDSDRYSFKVDFDYYEDGNNYYGLKKLCLNNSYADNGGLRESIAYGILRDLGLPVPNCAYSHITVNGEEWGLYLAVEPIDDVFLQTRFGDASGELYKPEGMGGVGADLAYRDDNLATYTGLVPKSGVTDGAAVIALMKALESGEGLEEVLDVEEALKYIAANVALANFDSYLGGTTHNYYLYEKEGVFSVLPWDLNLAFGGFGGGEVDIYEPADNSMGGGPGGRGKRGERDEQGEPGGETMEQTVDEAEQPMEQKQMPQEEQKQMPQEEQKQMPEGAAQMSKGQFEGMMQMGSEEKPLVETLLADEQLLAIYEGYLRQIAETYLTQDYMTAQVTRIHDLIAPYVQNDATAFYTYEEFEQVCSVDPTDPYSLVYYAVNMAESIQNQLAGGEPTFDTGSLQGGGMGNMGGKDGGKGGAPERSDRNQEMQNNEGAVPVMQENPAPDGFPSARNEVQRGEAPTGEGMPNQSGEPPEGMKMPPDGMPGEHPQKQPELKEYLPQMLICGGVFLVGLLFVMGYQRKKKL